MKIFTKPPLAHADQLALLQQRGLHVRDDPRAIQLLEVVTLFRLCPYMHPFQVPGDENHNFKDGANLADVVAVYRFDGVLRQLIMDALERVEVATRACISSHMCCTRGDAHWYVNRAHFKTGFNHSRLLEDIRRKQEKEKADFQREVARIHLSNGSENQKKARIESRKRDNYARFYSVTYDQPPLPPSWAMFEDISMGAVSQLFQNLSKDKDRKIIARRFDVPGEVLTSWLHTLTFVRNICAHHARLWNRELSITPRLPKSWQSPHVPAGHPRPAVRVYIVATILAHLMVRISPDSRWRERLVALVDKAPKGALFSMGFPDDWLEQPQWRNFTAGQNKDATEFTLEES